MLYLILDMTVRVLIQPTTISTQSKKMHRNAPTDFFNIKFLGKKGTMYKMKLPSFSEPEAPFGAINRMPDDGLLKLSIFKRCISGVLRKKTTDLTFSRYLDIFQKFCILCANDGGILAFIEI